MSLRDNRIVRRLRGDKGQSMVETAIVLPLLLLITFGIIEFGVLCYVDLALENGVSQASRFGITGIGGPSRQASILAELRRSTPTLTIDDSSIQFSHLSGGAWVSGIGGAGDVAKLTVTYRHNLIVLRPLVSGGQVTLQVESAMKNEDRFE
jgi:hypothetical protein